MNLKDTLNHHARNLVLNNKGIIEASIDKRIDYDARKLRKQTEVHVEGIESVYVLLKPEDVEQLKKFCEVALSIPDKPDQVYIENLYKEFYKIENLLKNL